MNNSIINKIIDYFFEQKRKKKHYKKLTNFKIIEGLKDGKLFVACIKSRNNNFISKQITKYSGPFSHVVVVSNLNNATLSLVEVIRIQEKLKEYYKDYLVSGEPNIDYLVMASADDNGMNYFDLAAYQNREMVIFDVTKKADKIALLVKLTESGPITKSATEGIISDFLSKEVMKANYDYTWLWGQMWKSILRKWKKLSRKVIKWFDDERAYGCSEQAEIFEKNGLSICDEDEPTPTEVYNYCLKNYPVVYSNI